MTTLPAIQFFCDKVRSKKLFLSLQTNEPLLTVAVTEEEAKLFPQNEIVQKTKRPPWNLEWQTRGDVALGHARAFKKCFDGPKLGALKVWETRWAA